MLRRNLLFVGVALIVAIAGCASSPPVRPAGRLAAAAGSGDAGPQAALTSAYVIGPEDVLTITVWKEDGLTRQVRVRPDGQISFPLVGDVRAAGITAAQLQSDLSSRLRTLLTAPAVTVIVDEINSYKVYVLGEVERPGLLPTKGPITVLQALALAGGLKPFADGSNMVLVRQADGQTYRARLSYGDVVLGRRGAVNLVLESGDTLVVP